MSSKLGIYDPTVHINSLNVRYKPNSIMYTDGFGEYKIRAQGGGGGSIETVFTKDVETQFSKFKFTVYADADTLELVRVWKNNANINVITVTDPRFSRTFAFAALITDVEVNIGADTEVELEFHSEPAS